MKLFTLLLIGTISFADGFYYHGAQSYRGAMNHHTVNHGTWVVPLAIGGIIGYVVGREQDDIYKPIPVYNVYLDKNRNTSYVEEVVYIESCDCYKKVLIKE
jgi:hypothetical protein